jgi:hypothetical protein
MAHDRRILLHRFAIRGWRLVLAGALSASTVEAQGRKTVTTVFGSVLRYNGDTIWQERDTTVHLAIYQGDTIKKLMFVNDKLQMERVYLASGDSARLVVIRMANGTTTSPVLPASPLKSVYVERMILESALLSEQAMAQLPFDVRQMMGEPEFSPPQPTRYVADASTTLVQHRDTLHYIRGCANRKTDTTRFIFFADDSVRRVSPAPARTFGSTMVVTLVSEMRAVLMQQFVATHSPARTDLPAIRDSCRPK